MRGRRKANRAPSPAQTAGGGPHTAQTLIERGNAALLQGDWRAAHASFQDALRIEETPQALEGLGMAAWWLEDDATVFDARARAYRLYRHSHDRRGAGRVAITIAEDYLQFRGGIAVAQGWHRRAHRLLADLGTIPELGWLKIWEGDLAALAGRPPGRIRELALEAADIAKALGDLDIEMTALALEGFALVVAGELTDGMPRLDEATVAAIAGDLTDPVAMGLSCCYLVMACERIRDFARAAQWCERVREFCERTGFNLLLAICRTQYAGVLAWQGSWREAEQELEAVAHAPEPPRPALQQNALLRLADLRRQQGRLEEAATLTTQVDEAQPIAILVRAALALERADHAGAVHLAQRFLRQVPASARADRVPALEVLLRARVSLGRWREARTALDELRAVAQAVGTEAVMASARFGEGIVAAAQGDYDLARRALEDACDLFARSGASLELGRCRLEHGRVLAVLEERDSAEGELRAALERFESLGAAGGIARTTAALADLRRAGGRPGGADGVPAGLTRREVEVLRLVAKGLSNAQIAKTLVVSEHTVKRHVANLLAKLDVPSRAAAAAYAVRFGPT